MFTQAGLGAARNVLERHVGEKMVPGAVGLIDRDGETHVFAVGAKAIGGDDPMRPDTIFRLTSMTKPITAAAVMMLVEEGRLRLDERVDRLLPELADRHVLRRLDAELDDVVPADRPIMVEDLLTFRCGLGLILAPPDSYPIQRAIAERALAGFGAPDPTLPYGPDEWLRRLGELPLIAQPGADWLYTAGSNLQGVLVARASGRPLSEFLAERIFAPLGMADTAFFVPPAKASRFVPAYLPAPDGLTLYDDPVRGAWNQAPSFEAGDAGLVGTAGDFLAFVRMLLDRRRGGVELLSRESLAAMQVDRLTAAQRKGGYPILAPGTGWGYGLSVVSDEAAAGCPRGGIGWTGGFGTSWISDPASDLTVILLTQRMFTDPTLPAIHREFQDAAFAAMR